MASCGAKGSSRSLVLIIDTAPPKLAPAQWRTRREAGKVLCQLGRTRSIHGIAEPQASMRKVFNSV
jgi:hypothetical protein